MKNQTNLIHISSDINLYVEKLRNCTNDIDDIFEQVNTNMKKIKDSDVWRGKTSDIINEKYEQLSQNYEVIDASLNKFATLFTKIYNGYEELDKIISDAIDDNIDFLSIE